MSLLANYYAAINAEKQAQVGLIGAQTQTQTLNNNEIGANAASTRGEQAARTASGFAQAKDLTSAANLNDVNATQVPLNGQAQRGLESAQAGLFGAQTGQSLVQTSFLPSISRANIASTIANIGKVGADVGLVGSQARGQDILNDRNAPSFVGQGQSKGTSKIKPEAGGKGMAKATGPHAGPSDTVPAMLTPGEAVLNKGAAEHYGTDVISHMNKMGLMRMAAQSEHAQVMGLPDPHAQPAAKGKSGGRKGKPMVQGFAMGVETVRPMTEFMTGLDATAIAGRNAIPTDDATAYARAVLHGVGG